ncbi:hypothetical protein EC912_10568 [Luteibacter rhizovicinus]|uniref:Lipoprotein n=1 Tax=Luteibacter rhizovicinus TaxID=242606 RepID=A0A4R3YNU7_9GAMM|nr:hypothetical protein [Luteibacter rhizovicinus]TCV93208.1 hypothetical protein EC912_10568 [Luteibacter rhizovicinus]
MKRLMAIAAVAVLSGCGGANDRVPVRLDNVIAAGPSSPWLTVEPATNIVPVSGLDHSVKIEPTPELTAGVEAQLRKALQPKYYTDLIVGCRGVQASVSVDKEATPATATMDLQATCRVTSRGVVVLKSYRVRQAVPVKTTATDLDYQATIPRLLELTSEDVANQIWATATTADPSAHK